MKYERSFRARWDKSLEEYGYAQISNVFLERYSNLGITNVEAMFLIHLLKHKWDVRNPYPSLNTVAKNMGVGRGTAQNYARNLEEKGFIKRIFRNHDTSEYNLEILIKILVYIAGYRNLDERDIKNAADTYRKLHTKEYPLKDSFIKDIK